MSDSIRASDWLFAALCLAAAAILAVVLWSTDSTGSRVVFRQNGSIVRSVPLDTDEKITITGQYTNVFEISDGSVRIVYTDCPNHQCEHSGTIRAPGSSIVCVPNETSATIEGPASEVDALIG